MIYAMIRYKASDAGSKVLEGRYCERPRTRPPSTGAAKAIQGVCVRDVKDIGQATGIILS